MDSTLRLSIQSAADEFKAHNFKKALSLYEQCIIDGKRKKTQANNSIVLNLCATKAAIEMILDRCDDAEETLASALEEDPFHVGLLVRRSQLHKKKNRITEASQDVATASLFTPDNLQIAAMKIQLDILVSKSPSKPQPRQDDQDSDFDFDQETSLQFANLRLIDRKSFTSSNSPISIIKNRESRVTISGDSAFFYDFQDEDENDKENNGCGSLSMEEAIRKNNQIDQELTAQTQSVDQFLTPKVKCQYFRQTKSILKNRNSVLHISNQSCKVSSRNLSFVVKLKDIDGKVIKPEATEKEVGFRKSIAFSPGSLGHTFPTSNSESKAKHPKQANSRKSCLKRSSFEGADLQSKATGTKTVRKSRFDSLSAIKIDGPILKKTQQSDHVKENDESKSAYSDDEGSSHNIYGSQFVLSKEIRENFGLDEETSGKKSKKERGKSILKKNSIFVGAKERKSRFDLQVSEAEIQRKPEKCSSFKPKSKKSVMFKGGNNQ